MVGRLGLLSLLMALVGCSYQLRSAEQPLITTTLALIGLHPSDPLARPLRRVLQQQGVDLDETAPIQLQLEPPQWQNTEQYRQRGGQAIHEVSVRLRYRILGVEGGSSPQQIHLTQSYSAPADAPLALGEQRRWAEQQLAEEVAVQLVGRLRP